MKRLFDFVETCYLLKNKRPTWCHFLFYFTSYALNKFRTLIYPSSGACDYSVELPHWSYCSWFGGLEFRCGWVGVVSVLQAEACNTDTTPTHRTKNNTTNVVIQQNSRKLLMMDILMSEICSAHKKWNKIASDIKLVFYSATITMMHGPINIISLLFVVCRVFWNLFYKFVARTVLTPAQQAQQNKLFCICNKKK